jgi:hypothetical protein
MSKRITLTYKALVLDEVTETEFTLPIEANDTCLFKELDSYFDNEVADLGFTGGTGVLRVTDDSPVIEINYWIDSLKPGCLEIIEQDTTSQLEDGVGEGGFEIKAGSKNLVVMADVNSPVKVEIHDDHCQITSILNLAITARDGDISALKSIINTFGKNDFNRHYQGHTPLQLAILYGHIEVVKVLLENGADPNALSVHRSAPLEDCVVTRSFDDDASSLVAKMLLNAGAKEGKANARQLAVDRKKPKTFDILS